VDTFAIDEHEVSRGQYRRCVDSGECARIDESTCQIYDGRDWDTSRQLPRPSRESEAPRTCVTRAEAAAYCAWVGTRLPTEAEWHLAAAGPENHIYPWGDTFDPERVAFLGRFDTEAGEVPHLVQTHSGRGPIAHMVGNAYEWVADDACTYDEWPAGENRCVGDGQQGVIRGGSFLSDAGGVRAGYRRFVDPEARYDTNGFRCAVSWPVD
jgi:formylglycine-generating enzyme required for sulfatase activity